MQVRDAFARNEIPLKQDRPTVYFSAILRVVRELFGELSNAVERLSLSAQKVEFADYETELGRLNQQKEIVHHRMEKLIRSIEEVRERTERLRGLVPIFETPS